MVDDLLLQPHESLLKHQQEFESFFRECMMSAMRNVLGEGGMRAVIYHLDLDRTNTIQSVHEKLISVFKMGAPVLERAIMKQVFSEMKMPYTESDYFDFTKEFEEAYSRFDMTGEKSITA
jgi:hypothetical protein